MGNAGTAPGTAGIAGTEARRDVGTEGRDGRAQENLVAERGETQEICGEANISVQPSAISQAWRGPLNHAQGRDSVRAAWTARGARALVSPVSQRATRPNFGASRRRAATHYTGPALRA